MDRETNSFNTIVAKDNYTITYRTNNRENFLRVQELCRLFIDISDYKKLKQKIKKILEVEHD